jgi:hypothetical protein
VGVKNVVILVLLVHLYWNSLCLFRQSLILDRQVLVQK